MKSDSSFPCVSSSSSLNFLLSLAASSSLGEQKGARRLFDANGQVIGSCPVIPHLVHWFFILSSFPRVKLALLKAGLRLACMTSQWRLSLSNPSIVSRTTLRKSYSCSDDSILLLLEVVQFLDQLGLLLPPAIAVLVNYFLSEIKASSFSRCNFCVGLQFHSFSEWLVRSRNGLRKDGHGAQACFRIALAKEP